MALKALAIAFGRAKISQFLENVGIYIDRSQDVLVVPIPAGMHRRWLCAASLDGMSPNDGTPTTNPNNLEFLQIYEIPLSVVMHCHLSMASVCGFAQ